MQTLQSIIENLDKDPPSRGITRTTARAVLDSERAALLGSIIDRARLVMGWNRLAQGTAGAGGKYVAGEQDAAIIAWYEIIADAGVPPERWNDCYRAAQTRKNELKAQGKDSGIVTPGDLVVEWGKIKNLHQEINNVRQLPERAAAACERCGGHGREEMPDGSVREGCEHRPMSNDERDARARRRIEQLTAMRADLRKPSPPQPVQAKPKPAAGQVLQCSTCARKVNTLLGWEINETCKMKLDRESELCPKCEQPTGVLSQRNMVCRECFHVYDVVTCSGQMREVK